MSFVYDHSKGVKLTDFRSLSGIEYQRIYDENAWNKTLSDAGEYPFTRGIYKNMYRERLWTVRQQHGYGLPEESNERIKFLLGAGQTGLNVNGDIAAKLGLDPDHSLAQGDVGLQGTSMSTYEDMVTLFKDVPIDRIGSL